MILGIVGSRNFKDIKFVKDFVDHLPIGTIVISGGANGVDNIAIKQAKKKGLKTRVKKYLPDWDKYGKSAGPIRNSLIVKDADLIMAFWDGKSKGTKDTINKAIKSGKLINSVDDYEKLRPWKLFKRREIFEAEQFAKDGGIAIHLMGDATVWLNEKSSAQTIRAFKGKDFAHIFGPNKKLLTYHAEKLGCKSIWIQHPNIPGKMHYDLTGSKLKKAIKKCETYSAKETKKLKS